MVVVKFFEGLHGKDCHPYVGYGLHYPNLDIILTLYCK